MVGCCPGFRAQRKRHPSWPEYEPVARGASEASEGPSPPQTSIPRCGSCAGPCGPFTSIRDKNRCGPCSGSCGPSTTICDKNLPSGYTQALEPQPGRRLNSLESEVCKPKSDITGSRATHSSPSESRRSLPRPYWAPVRCRRDGRRLLSLLTLMYSTIICASADLPLTPQAPKKQRTGGQTCRDKALHEGHSDDGDSDPDGTQEAPRQNAEEIICECKIFLRQHYISLRGAE